MQRPNNRTPETLCCDDGPGVFGGRPQMLSTPSEDFAASLYYTESLPNAASKGMGKKKL
jgi:hypothetical protein